MQRRRFLETVTVATVWVAGCTGDGGDGGDGGGEAISGEDYPSIDEWLTETEVGDADGTYDDERDSDTVDIDVGASGNGGNLAFGPSAVVVSAGTTVRWNWTGEGGAHNVEAEPDDQIGESDYEFSSGEAVDSDSEQFTQTLDSAGVALYHCEPHLAVGMKGGIAVE
jgi:halocyanin-like protein